MLTDSQPRTQVPEKLPTGACMFISGDPQVAVVELGGEEFKRWQPPPPNGHKLGS